MLYFKDYADEKLNNQEHIDRIIKNEFSNLNTYMDEYYKIFKDHHPTECKEIIIEKLKIEIAKQRISKVIYTNFLKRYKNVRKEKEVGKNSVVDNLISVMREYFVMEYNSFLKKYDIDTNSQWLKKYNVDQAKWFRDNFDNNFKSNDLKEYEMSDIKSYDKSIPKIINRRKIYKTIEVFMNSYDIDIKYQQEAKRHYSSIVAKIQFCCISELENIPLRGYKKYKMIENITIKEVGNNKKNKEILQFNEENKEILYNLL